MDIKLSSPYSLLLTAFLLIATSGSAHTDTLEDGVSQLLANERSKTLSNIEYQLHFNIPESKAQKVTGSATLHFHFHGKGDLVLDFAGDGFNGRCIVNGKRIAAKWIREHILIPNRHLKQGANELSLSFVSADAALNRHDDYLYTLFVPARARTAFPCFDQPNLKATAGRLEANQQRRQPSDTHLPLLVHGRKVPRKHRAERRAHAPSTLPRDQCTEDRSIEQGVRRGCALP